MQILGQSFSFSRSLSLRDGLREEARGKSEMKS